MLAISDQVYQSFARKADADFDRRAFDFLSRQFPELHAVRGNDGLHRFVIAGSNRATLSGCRSEQEIMLFLSLQAMFGDDFDHEPRYADSTAPLYGNEGSMQSRLELTLDRMSVAVPV